MLKTDRTVLKIFVQEFSVSVHLTDIMKAEREKKNSKLRKKSPNLSINVAKYYNHNFNIINRYVLSTLFHNRPA